jgi:5-methylcytosine-specific restriction endonuclease McrA
MPKKPSKPGDIHLRIVGILKRFPEGISAGQIRAELEKEGLAAGDQIHLERRKRDLKKWFRIEKSKGVWDLQGKRRNVVLYKYLGEKTDITDEGQISLKLRAQVIHAAYGRCQMCGNTVAKDFIKLVVDHRTPRDWGGTNDLENLWAVCEDCNAGKKAFFSSLDPAVMRKATAHDSVHVRIGELLKAVGVGHRTPSSVLAVVADQDDWQKRLRELRYPVIGWDIETHLYKTSSGKKLADYILRSYKPWPENPSEVIRRFEKEREEKNRKRSI